MAACARPLSANMIWCLQLDAVLAQDFSVVGVADNGLAEVEARDVDVVQGLDDAGEVCVLGRGVSESGDVPQAHGAIVGAAGDERRLFFVGYAGITRAE